MADAPVFTLMHRRTGLPTVRTERHLLGVLTQEVQHFPLPLFLQRIVCDHQPRQSQQGAQGSRCHAFKHQSHRPFRGPRRVSNDFDWGTQQ